MRASGLTRIEPLLRVVEITRDGKIAWGMRFGLLQCWLPICRQEVASASPDEHLGYLAQNQAKAGELKLK